MDASELVAGYKKGHCKHGRTKSGSCRRKSTAASKPCKSGWYRGSKNRCRKSKAHFKPCPSGKHRNSKNRCVYARSFRSRRSSRRRHTLANEKLVEWMRFPVYPDAYADMERYWKREFPASSLTQLGHSVRDYIFHKFHTSVKVGVSLDLKTHPAKLVFEINETAKPKRFESSVRQYIKAKLDL